VRPAGRPLIVGASVASGENPFLPEVLTRPRQWPGFGIEPNILLAGEATEPEVAARLTTASTIILRATLLNRTAGHGCCWHRQDGGISKRGGTAEALPG